MNGIERQRIRVLMIRTETTANLMKCPTVKADGSRDNFILSAFYMISSVLEICCKLMNLGCSFDTWLVIVLSHVYRNSVYFHFRGTCLAN